MKKIIAAVIAALAVAAVAVLILVNRPENTVSFPVHVEGAIFSESEKPVDVDIVFNPDWVTKKDSTVFNPELAQFAALVSADTYFREKDLAKGTQNRVLIDGTESEDYSRNALLEKAGFTDIRYIESYKEKEYDCDQNDSVTIQLGYMNAGDKYDLFIVAVRGCFSSGEWISVFDTGAEGDGYLSLTGNHSDWEDHSIIKSYSVAAKRAEQFEMDYIAEHDDPDRENRVLITGHSRGGAIAGILGSHLEESGVRCCTYTFNSAAASLSDGADDCKTVFNVFDSGDFFSDLLAFKDEKISRIGRELTYDIASSDEIVEKINSLQSGAEYMGLSSEQKEEYKNLFSDRFSCRADLYQMKTVSEKFADEAEALARAEELNTLIGAENGLGLEPLVKAEADGDTVTVEFYDAALLTSMGKILAYGDAAAAAAKTIFARDDGFCAIADFLTANADAITAGHLLVNGYVLSGYVK